MTARRLRIGSGSTRLVAVGILALGGAIALAAAGPEKPRAEVVANRPSVGFMFPLSVPVGGSAEIELSGSFLDRAVRIRCECDDLSAEIASANPLKVKAVFTAAPTAAPGPRFVYVDTAAGPSNRLLLRVTGLPRFVDAEPNDSRQQPQSIKTPALIDGKIETVHDSDMYRFHAAAGERLAFNFLGGRSNARGHVVAILLQEDGSELAHNLSRFGTDPYLDHTFEEEGDYILAVVPRRFSDFYTVVSDEAKINWQYQAAIGTDPIPWSIFPMGGKIGTTVEAELHADFVDPAAGLEFVGEGLSISLVSTDDPCGCRFKATIVIAEDAELGPHYLAFPGASGAAPLLAFDVGDMTEMIEKEPNDGLSQGQPVTLPTIVNGRIDGPHDRDGFLFNVDQFDDLAFEVDARGLGSHITDPNLTLARPDGRLSDTGDDRCTTCGAFFSAVRAKEKLDSSIRHYFQEGNPNDADAAGDYVLQIRDNSALGGEDHTYRLLLRDRKPGFRLGVLSAAVHGNLGGVAKVPVVLEPREGFKGVVAVRAVDLPDGLSAEPIELRPDEPSGTLEIRHDPTALPPDAAVGWLQFDVRLVGSAEIDGKDVVRKAELPSYFSETGAGYNEIPRDAATVVFVKPALFSLGIDEPFRGFRLQLAKGGRVEVPVALARAEEFDEGVEFSGIELPEGLRVETGEERDGKVLVSLVGDPDLLERGPHRIVLRGTPRQGDPERSQVTKPFTVAVN